MRRGKRHSRSWWSETVERWQRSGLTGAQFAKRHGVSRRTLLWWSSALRRGTRAERESAAAMVPLEVRVTRPVAALSGSAIEIAVGRAVLRVEVGTEVRYVSELVQRLGTSS